MTTGNTSGTPKTKKDRASEGMAGLAKGLAIIEAFGEHHEHLSVASAASITGISRASARRCLLTLTETGYLLHEGSKFKPTPRMLRLGAAYYESASLPQLAVPHLETARDILNESISLAILEEDHAVFIARAEAERIISSLAKLGGRLPAYASATGRVLLAALPPKQLKAYLSSVDLKKLTPKTIVDKRQILDRIETVKHDGFEISNDELEEGIISMAVSVKDKSGDTVAAMSMSASSARISAEQLHQTILPILQIHARALSQSL